MSTGRKVFHCAVDETALTTNISEIKKWTTNGAITLIVPLYTLERLHALKRAGSQIAINAREAVRFLDRVTSGKDNIASERVALQGPMEQYEEWSEAEKYFLPEFEEEPEVLNGDVAVEQVSAEKRQEKRKDQKKSDANQDDLSQMLLNKLNFKKESDAVSITSNGTHSAPASRPSSRSSRTSPECANSHMFENGGGSSDSKVRRANGHQRSASGSTIPTVPLVLRPLLSALLWRLHSGPDASNAAKNCILITNDRPTQIWAQKFGIGVKNIHQLRTSIQYEEREYKNRCKYVEKTQATEPKSLLSYDDESDEDELVFVPRGRGKGASRGGASRSGNNRKAASSKTVAQPTETAIEIPTQPIDPNSFSRSLNASGKQQPTVDLSTQTGAARGIAGASRHSTSGRRGASRGASRGGGRGRGKLWVP
ncbi:hypothetical protein EYZ11_000393 [Aspergillus tanneri]|uniref:PIN domain-containing protein n=1 Tax=Aspergillus tanneri TaxID=1220188 RepID=A0A4S3JX91_9EURO|nr:uncharacterized protein ATNIH1004_006799 [Aspergillus tanneri]KAA8645380.1 hypothetical protein ATNIH1004_006799 [Aspergillus tanneri]THD00068.1 hypothetical protein EYZ11_000393 [Aspergillus tanneri]